MNYKKISSFFTLLLFDILTISVSYVIAYFLRTAILSIFFKELTAPLPFQVFIARFYLVIPFVLIFAYEGLYHKRYEFWEETRLLWKSNFIATAIIMVFLYITKGFQVSRAIVIIAFACNIILLPIQRNLIKKILFKVGLWVKNILVIGSQETQEELSQQFSKHPILGYKSVSYFDISSAAVESNKLAEILNEKKINGIIVDAQNLDESKILEIYEYAEGKVKDFFVIPALRQLQIAGVEIEQLENILLMKYHYNLLRTESRIAKRIFDLLISFIGLLLCIPIFIIIVFLIKLSSKGQVFFLQLRVGKDNQLFSCYKFRTMYQNSQERLDNLLKTSNNAKEQWEKYLKVENDPRVTKIGKFLRQTSLDELPQLWSVFIGKMSLVGPRPYLPQEVKNLKQKMVIIAKTTPGMTGLWQVSGRSKITFKERMRLDEYYVKNWTIWLDFVIIIKTMKVPFNAEGAY